VRRDDRAAHTGARVDHFQNETAEIGARTDPWACEGSAWPVKHGADTGRLTATIQAAAAGITDLGKRYVSGLQHRRRWL